MGYGKKIYAAAAAELERRRRSAEEEAEDRLQRFYEACPKAEAVRAEMSANAARAAAAVFQGESARAAIEELQTNGLALKAEYEALLKEHGFAPQDMEPRYACSLCRDTGIADGKRCRCLKALERSMAYEALSMDVPLEKCTFETFSLDHYKNDERVYRQMEKVLNACKSYAEKFRKDSPSLLFRGNTGLGKTHLSLAIAGKALEKGFGVIYGSAQNFAVALEKSRFDREEDDEPEDVNSQLISCDLLILDDLGTEFPSKYVNAALYNILNTRMLAGKPTIVSTNLSMKELEARYSERFASRVAGSFGMLEFQGSDVRIAMRKQAAARRGS